MLERDRDELIRTLSQHPGFKELLAMFDEEYSVLRAKLETERQKSIEDYYFLQAGLKWLKYAKLKSVQAVDKRLESLAARPVPTEMEQLTAVLSNFESV